MWFFFKIIFSWLLFPPRFCDIITFTIIALLFNLKWFKAYTPLSALQKQSAYGLVFLHTFHTSQCVNVYLYNSETPVFHFFSSFLQQWFLLVMAVCCGTPDQWRSPDISCQPLYTFSNPILNGKSYKMFCRLLATANYCSGANSPE